MVYQYIKPSKILEPFIKHYWVLEVDKTVKDTSALRIFPTGFTELILYYGDRYLHIDKNNSKTLQPSFFFTGQSSSYYNIAPTGKIGLIAITFKPDAAKLFFKMPISDVENNFVALEDVLGSTVVNLEHKLQTAGENKERIQIIEEFLTEQLKELYTDYYKRINHSVNKINQNRGLISVDSLASEACLSTKQFNRKFTEFVGIQPKQFTRIVRFQYAIYSQQTQSVKSLTELAYKCGYYDQAHFTNEFKSFTGYAPKDFFKMCEPHSDYFS